MYNAINMMDWLSDTSALSLWLIDHGSLALFVLLALGIVALPVPEETLMTVAGVLMREGKLSIVPTTLAAYAGAMVGITLSYCIGKTLGLFVLHKYGRYIGITESRLAKVHGWFERIGKWALTIGYFIPGVRHLTGCFAGLSELNYIHFALFAYSGALLWASTFLLLGYFIGDYVFHVAVNLEIADWFILLAAMLILLIIIFVYYQLKRKK